jgi:hypothetical protein
MQLKPTYTVMEACSLIVACTSVEEIKTMKDFLIQDLERYSLTDQGFLMTMTGIQIMKIEDGHENVDRFFRECIFASFGQSTDN